MTNLEKAFNGGMTREEADEVFSKLTTAEALELLKEDIACEDEILYFNIESPFIEYFDFDKNARSIEVDTLNKSINLNLDGVDHTLTVRFTDCEVKADYDYDTTEDGNYCESKNYYLKAFDRFGNVEISIEITV